MKLGIFLGSVVAIVAVIFAFQNQNTITVEFFSFVFTGSAALLILSALLVGFLIGTLLFVPSNLSLLWKARQLARENDLLKRKAHDETIQYEAPGLGEEGEGQIDIA
ncbi:MAG: hypothetical protein RL150_333 [Candidatus Parcubacteria bacterium]|jgi:putative membrane protein